MRRASLCRAAAAIAACDARGDFVCFLDRTDYWLPGTLAVILDVLAQHPRLRLSASKARHWRRMTTLHCNALWPEILRAGRMRRCARRPANASLGWAAIFRPPLLVGDFFSGIIYGDLFFT